MASVRRLLEPHTGRHRHRRNLYRLQLALAVLAFLGTLGAFLASPPVQGVVTLVPGWLRRSAAGSGGLLAVACVEAIVAVGLVVEEWLRAAEDRRDMAEWQEAVRQCEVAYWTRGPWWREIGKLDV